MSDNGTKGAAGDIQGRMMLVLEECADGNRGQLARDIGLTRQAVSAWTRGASVPSLEAAAAMLRAYPELRPGWLIAGEGEPFRTKVAV